MFYQQTPNIRIRTDLNAKAVLRQDFRDPTYAKIPLPIKKYTSHKLAIEFLGETRDVELLEICSELKNGQHNSFIAIQDCEKETSLDQLAKSGSLTGLIYKNPEFNQPDLANLKKLIPNLQTDHCCVINVGQDFVTASFLIFLILFFATGWLLLSFRRVIAGWRNDQMWRIEVARASYLDKSLVSHIEPDLVESHFQFADVAEPKTSWIVWFLIHTFTFILTVALGIAISVAVRNPLGNIWASLASLLGFVALMIFNSRFMPWGLAWLPVQRLRSCKKQKFTESGFHRYHQAVLKALGFCSVGYFKLGMLRKLQLFSSPDQTIVACIGIEQTEKKLTKHFCLFESYFSDTGCIKTSVNSLADERDAESTIEAEEMVFEALTEHLQAVESACRIDGNKVVAVEDANVVEVIDMMAKLEKIRFQEDLASDQSNGSFNWQMLSDWIRNPQPAR